MGVTPPYRIETDRLVIRCYEPEDAALLKEAVDSSLEHLRPWMPWARYEPQDLDQKVELLRMFRGQFDRDENYTYGIFAFDESRLLGGSGLHPRSGPESIEIGYWIRADATGQGIATEVTAVLTRAAIEQSGYERVDIQVDPENELSLRIPRRLGFTEEGTAPRAASTRRRTAARGATLCCSRCSPTSCRARRCVSFAYRGYDAIGRDA